MSQERHYTYENVQYYPVKETINYDSFRSYLDNSMQVVILSRIQSSDNGWADSQAIETIGWPTPATYSYGFAI